MSDEFKIEWERAPYGSRAIVGFFTLECCARNNVCYASVTICNSTNVLWCSANQNYTESMARTMAEQAVRRIAREMLWLAGGVK
jgi:hypothetical protein